MGWELKRVPAYFYRSDSGREPVREWLKSLNPADRKIIGEDIKDVEYAWPLGMPLVRSLGQDLWGSAAVLAGAGSHGSSSVWMKGGWCCCMALSRRVGKRRRTIWRWRDGVRREKADEEEARRNVVR